MTLIYDDALEPHRRAQTVAQKEGSLQYLVGHTVRWYGWVNNVWPVKVWPDDDSYRVSLSFRPWQCNEKGTRSTNWVDATVYLDDDEWATEALDLNLEDMVAVTCEVKEIWGELNPKLVGCTEVAIVKRSDHVFHTLKKGEDSSCEPGKRYEPWPPDPEVLRKAGFRAEG